MTLFGGTPELIVGDCGGFTTDFASSYPPNDWHKLLGKVHLGGDGSQGFTPCCGAAINALIGNGTDPITLPMASGIYVPIHVKNTSAEFGDVKLYPTIAGVSQPVISLGTMAAEAESLALVPINCTRSDTFLFECRADVEMPYKYSCSNSTTVTAHIVCDPSEQVGVEDTGTRLPHLYPAQPSPFSTRTQIVFDLPEPGPVRLEVFGIRGECIRTLFEGDLDAGAHSLVWRGDDAKGSSAPPGIYFYRLMTPYGGSTGKLVRVR